MLSFSLPVSAIPAKEASKRTVTRMILFMDSKSVLVQMHLFLFIGELDEDATVVFSGFQFTDTANGIDGDIFSRNADLHEFILNLVAAVLSQGLVESG